MMNLINTLLLVGAVVAALAVAGMCRVGQLVWRAAAWTTQPRLGGRAGKHRLAPMGAAHMLAVIVCLVVVGMFPMLMGVFIVVVARHGVVL